MLSIFFQLSGERVGSPYPQHSPYISWETHGLWVAKASKVERYWRSFLPYCICMWKWINWKSTQRLTGKWQKLMRFTQCACQWNTAMAGMHIFRDQRKCIQCTCVRSLRVSFILKNISAQNTKEWKTNYKTLHPMPFLNIPV